MKKVRIHREGVRLLTGAFLLLLVVDCWFFTALECRWPFYLMTLLSVLVYIVMVNFFRCPIRLFGDETEGVVVAPADGKVVLVEEVDEDEYLHDRRKMVSIFMSLVNVHANWYPVDGVVRKVIHQDGRFYLAWLPKASPDNERSTVLIETPNGQMVMVRQIAGALARRIVTYAVPDEDCFIDEHMGFIKFGSRVDVYLPMDAEVLVKPGQAATGNETVIARMKVEGKE